MSTKNLARTIIEGGRVGYSKWSRRHSHAQERALSRAYLIDGMRLEHGFDAVPIGQRPKAYKAFADKLGAPRRWLRSHVGRPWGAVRAEMFARFDPRTIAGQHILFDHMLREVRMPGDVDPWSRFRDELFVDARGILRLHRPRPLKAKPKPKLRCAGSICRAYRCDGAAALAAFMAGRKIGGQAAALYWFTPTGTCEPRTHENCCCPRRGGRALHGAHEHHRQDWRLTAEEAAFWAALCEWHKAECRHVPARSAL